MYVCMYYVCLSGCTLGRRAARYRANVHALLCRRQVTVFALLLPFSIWYCRYLTAAGASWPPCIHVPSVSVAFSPPPLDAWSMTADPVSITYKMRDRDGSGWRGESVGTKKRNKRETRSAIIQLRLTCACPC